MLHASAAFKGGDIQKKFGRGRTLNGGTLHFMGGLINPLETMSSLPFKQQPQKMVKHVSPVCGVGV